MEQEDEVAGTVHQPGILGSIGVVLSDITVVSDQCAVVVTSLPGSPDSTPRYI